MQAHYGALPVLYVPVWVTYGALVTQQYTYTPPCCRTLLYHRTFICLSVSLLNDLTNPVFDSDVLMGFESRANAFLFS